MRNLAKTSTKRLAKLITKDSGHYRYQVDDILDSLIRVLHEELKNGQEVILDNIGVFYIKTKAANRIYMHKTGEYHDYPERKRVLFKVAHTLKRAVEPSYDYKATYAKYNSEKLDA